MRHVNVADAGLHAGVLHHFGYGGGDVEQLRAAFGAHGEFAGGGVSRGFGWASGHGYFKDAGLKLASRRYTKTALWVARLKPRSWDGDQQAAADADGLLVARPKAVVVTRFEKPAESMLPGRPKHKIQDGSDSG